MLYCDISQDKQSAYMETVVMPPLSDHRLPKKNTLILFDILILPQSEESSAILDHQDHHMSGWGEGCKPVMFDFSKRLNILSVGWVTVSIKSRNHEL